jgi:DNA (cytosine-5)-methyltransferase 1
MKYLSVCSGIEAASVAWHPLGWEALAFSEIEPFPRKVLAHHYPDVPLHGDFTVLREQNWIKDANILVGGTPCQAFSVAGLRNSLDDDRGNLTLEFVRLADAIDNLRRTGTIIVWENVPGVLSVKDNAFGCFLAAITGNDATLVPTGGKWTNAGMVVGPKRTAAWRILDAQYFGVAQRRRRVFVVASARDDFDPAEVLFEREGVRRDIAPSREPGQKPSATITARFGISRNHEECVSMTLQARMGAAGFDLETETPLIVGTIGARTGLSRGVQDAESGHLMVAQPIPLDTMNIIERPSDERRANRIGRGYGEAGDPMFTITKGHSHAVAQPIAIHPHVIGRSANAGPQGKEYLMDGSAYTMDSRGVAQSVAQPICLMDQGGSVMNIEHDMTGALRRETHGHEPVVMQSMAVRRLTPRECERLQGFPDDYTDIPGAADGPRYKALGNSMAVPVMAWIGKRIKKCLQTNLDRVM